MREREEDDMNRFPTVVVSEPEDAGLSLGAAGTLQFSRTQHTARSFPDTGSGREGCEFSLPQNRASILGWRTLTTLGKREEEGGADRAFTKQTSTQLHVRWVSGKQTVLLSNEAREMARKQARAIKEGEARDAERPTQILDQQAGGRDTSRGRQSLIDDFLATKRIQKLIFFYPECEAEHVDLNGGVERDAAVSLLCLGGEQHVGLQWQQHPERCGNSAGSHHVTTLGSQRRGVLSRRQSFLSSVDQFIGNLSSARLNMEKVPAAADWSFLAAISQLSTCRLHLCSLMEEVKRPQVKKGLWEFCRLPSPLRSSLERAACWSTFRSDDQYQDDPHRLSSTNTSEDDLSAAQGLQQMITTCKTTILRRDPHLGPQQAGAAAARRRMLELRGGVGGRSDCFVWTWQHYCCCQSATALTGAAEEDLSETETGRPSDATCRGGRRGVGCRESTPHCLTLPNWSIENNKEVFSESGPCGAGGSAGSRLDEQTRGDCAKNHPEDDHQRHNQSSVQPAAGLLQDHKLGGWEDPLFSSLMQPSSARWRQLSRTHHTVLDRANAGGCLDRVSKVATDTAGVASGGELLLGPANSPALTMVLLKTPVSPPGPAAADPETSVKLLLG
ncbi:dynein heavy chain 5, axonemal-like protein, partial [Lates japonicus]